VAADPGNNLNTHHHAEASRNALVFVAFAENAIARGTRPLGDSELVSLLSLDGFNPAGKLILHHGLSSKSSSLWLPADR
jgi:hypothetical protein